MRSNTEFRELAWKRLWADHWFGRLFGGGLLLSLCGHAVNVLIGGVLGRLGVRSWLDYARTVVQGGMGLSTAAPDLTSQFVSQATSSTALMLFCSLLMAGIASYGYATVMRKCRRMMSRIGLSRRSADSGVRSECCGCRFAIG